VIRFEDEDTGEVIPTRVHCKLFDSAACSCSDYANRKAQVPDCIKLTPHNIEALEWMPKSCAYRRLHEGRPLAAWHPLVSGESGDGAYGRGVGAGPDDFGTVAGRAGGCAGFRGAGMGGRTRAWSDSGSTP
jgi:hypothetical protein